MTEEQTQPIEKLEVGDKIVRFGRVFEVFDVTKEKNPCSGEEEEIIHFKPVYATQANQTLVCAIPIKNIERTNIRLPMSDEEVEALLKMMKGTVDDPTKRFNTRQAKEVLKSNDPEKIALILKRLAVVRRDPDTNFTYTKKRIFRQAMKRLQEEIALVKEIEIEEARDLLARILKVQAVESLPLDEDGDIALEMDDDDDCDEE